MKRFISYKRTAGLAFAGALFTLFSCNKNIPEPIPIEFPGSSGNSIGTIISTDPNFSILRAAAAKAGTLALLQDSTRTMTLFAPDNAAFAASGIPSEGALAFFSAGLLDTVLKCHLVSRVVPASAIPQTFPNLPYPTFFNPAPTLTSLARLNVFPSTRNGAWLNNIPLKQTDIAAYNGVIHKVAAVVMPPSRVLWNRINTDTVSTNPNALAYLRAAIIRADSGYAPNAAPSLIYYLNNPLANFTVFAPTDAAFRTTLTGAIAQALIAQGMPPADALATAAALASTPAVFSNPALYGVLTAQTVRGIVAYHVLGNRAFSNNLPTTATAYPTLLNGVVAAHPGITLQATFGAPPFVTAATVKGLANATASNVLITLPPALEPAGSSDQHYVNGVLHKIDQVLLPQ